MEAEKVADSMLEECGLGSIDAARLTLEMTENLGQLAQGKPRAELLLILRRVIHAGVQAVEREEYTVSLETAAWASVEARRDRVRPVTLRDLRHYVRRILKVEGVSGLQLRNITTGMCRHILRQAFGSSRHSYVKGRAILHSIFAYGIRREWCDSNPVARIEVPRVEEKQIVPLSPDAVERLLACARESDMQLSLNLLLFSGVRPAEVARLKPSDFYWEEQQVIIRPRASKTGGGRVVPLRLNEDLPEELRTIPGNRNRRWRRLRLTAGFAQWASDSCRHTFASYHAAYFKNLPALQLEMGHHNLDLLRSRYMAPALGSRSGLGDVSKLVLPGSFTGVCAVEGHVIHTVTHQRRALEAFHRQRDQTTLTGNDCKSAFAQGQSHAFSGCKVRIDREHKGRAFEGYEISHQSQSGGQLLEYKFETGTAVAQCGGVHGTVEGVGATGPAVHIVHRQGAALTTHGNEGLARRILGQAFGNLDGAGIESQSTAHSQGTAVKFQCTVTVHGHGSCGGIDVPPCTR